MEEHVYIVRSYLPVDFNDPDTNEFIDYLLSAYVENLGNKKYQFSFTSFHMMYMSYIYKIKWFLKQNGYKPVEDIIQSYPKQERYKNSHFNTLFDLSAISETQSLTDLLKSLTFHTSVIENTKHHVTVRNNCSHAVGKILYKRDNQIENYILEELENIEAIHKKVKPFFKPLIEKFVDDNYEKNLIDSDIKAWVFNNYLSQKDIGEILEVELPFLKQKSNNKEIFFKKILYCLLINELVAFVEDKGDYFINSLSSLMNGISPQIDIKTNTQDADRFKSTQELIEEKIIPILTTLNNDDALKAQQILQLNS